MDITHRYGIFGLIYSKFALNVLPRHQTVENSCLEKANDAIGEV